MKHTHKATLDNNPAKGDTMKMKWVVIRLRPTNDLYFQFLRKRRWWDWVNNTSDAAIFDSQFAASCALSVHNTFNFAGGAFVAKLS